METEQACKNCRYSRAPLDAAHEGRCRRYPPAQLVLSEDVWFSSQPAIKPDDWCGEWQPIPVPKLPLKSHPIKALGLLHVVAEHCRRNNFTTVGDFADGPFPGDWDDVADGRVYDSAMRLLKFGVVPVWIDQVSPQLFCRYWGRERGTEEWQKMIHLRLQLEAQ